MNIRILSSASDDLVDGYWFYEKQQEGLGSYFLDSLFSDLDSLTIYAGIHTLYFNKYYRMLSKHFPFAIYYRVDNELAHVYAVLDCRRDPAWIREMVDKR